MQRDCRFMGLGRRLFMLACVPLLGGCGGRPAGYPETAPVRGRVTLGGEPLGGAAISFIPAKGRSSAGLTDLSGYYELHYAGRIKGAMLGKHRVSISYNVPDEKRIQSRYGETLRAEGDYQAPLIESLPERYYGATSELTAEVTSGPNTVDFALLLD
jgi:hypothetical protein